ncbi:hypothetical protein SAMN02787118_113227 [Streptomyces mirabilis]|jgi:hypothetical protein|uniref:Uncharacterized protein n=1 Tax=Streptomyces mirabilis TaxID=68239 RepID=A0A1I2MML6_9ACTN|nr:hypothetical protein SAMN02787118_113227 [Streptomyces mirabilis]
MLVPPMPDGPRTDPQWTLSKKLVTLRQLADQAFLSDSEGFLMLFAQGWNPRPVAGLALTWITSKANISPIWA